MPHRRDDLHNSDGSPASGRDETDQRNDKPAHQGEKSDPMPPMIMTMMFVSSILDIDTVVRA